MSAVRLLLRYVAMPHMTVAARAARQTINRRVKRDCRAVSNAEACMWTHAVLRLLLRNSYWPNRPLLGLESVVTSWTGQLVGLALGLA